jgi:ABC-2 type transport system permease protein
MAAKYLKFFQTEFRIFTEYKLDFMSKFVQLFVNIALTLMIWSAIFEVTGRTEIAGFNKYMFLSYMVIIRLISQAMLAWMTTRAMEELIFSGNLSNFITKPVNINIFMFSRLMFSYLFYAILGFTIFIIALPVLDEIGLSIFSPSITNWILFGISVLLALIIHMIFYYCFSLLTFWFGRVWSIIEGIKMIQRFFAGYFVPLAISPLLSSIASVMPFKHMLSTPVMIYLEQVSMHQAIMDISIQIAWIIALYIIASLILRIGLKKFDSQGG